MSSPAVRLEVLPCAQRALAAAPPAQPFLGEILALGWHLPVPAESQFCCRLSAQGGTQAATSCEGPSASQEVCCTTRYQTRANVLVLVSAD